MPSGQSGPPPVRKHLMTPGQPRPQQRYNTSLTSVQRWVMSTLVATTILHLAVGVVVAAYFSDRLDSQIGLLVISALFGLIAFAAALLIHKRSPLSWWLLPGLVPALVGAYLLFG
jgi:uncharacterized membrane protein YoaK (UPF0700 family)